MDSNWVCAFSTRMEYLAEIAKRVLGDNDIESVVMNKKDSSYLDFGDVEVYVNAENLIRAKHLLKELQD